LAIRLARALMQYATSALGLDADVAKKMPAQSQKT